MSPAVLLGELLAHAAVDLVEDVALAPGRPAAVDELVEEHAVQEAREEGGGVLHAAPGRAPQPEERRLVEADEGLGVDSDQGETRSVTLQYNGSISKKSDIEVLFLIFSVGGYPKITNYPS